MKDLKVRLTLTEEALGMMPADKELHETYIASNAPDAPSLEEEIAAVGVDGVVEKTKTVFPKMDGVPFYWDYQIRGMFKDSIGMLRRVPGTACSKLKAYKKAVDGLLFVNERKIPIQCSGPIGDCQRPLRADTPQGSRVALAHSETVPAGSTLEFTVHMMVDDLEPVVRECLDYGARHGLGQWRSSGKGAFTWQELGDGGKIIGGNNAAAGQ